MTSSLVTLAVSSWTSRLLGTWNVSTFGLPFCGPLPPFLAFNLSLGILANCLSSASVGYKYLTKPVEHNNQRANEKCGPSFWMTLIITKVITNWAPRSAYNHSWGFAIWPKYLINSPYLNGNCVFDSILALNHAFPNFIYRRSRLK